MAESRDFFVLPENLGQRLMGLSENNEDDDSLAYVSSSLAISTDPKMVAHGRGLVTKAPIQAGELLFVHPPTIHAEISQVLRIYKNKASASTREATSSSLLESIAETVLLKEMKRAVRGRKKESSARMAASFLALNSNHSTKQNVDAGDTEKEKDQQLALLKVLLGKGNVEETEKILEDCGTSMDDNDYLLGIIRHNAFGPDFHHYHRMEAELSKNNDNNNNNNNNNQSTALYSRILGHYPLAAMINHSCGPTNATRVFYKEIMVATATQAIPSGTEIVWPYCPPISPLPARNDQLENCYGFSCLSSNRSALEKKAYEIGIPTPEIPLGLENENSLKLDLQQWEKLLKTLDVWYMVVAAKIELPSSNEEEQKQLLQYGLRLGHTQLYIKYFNQALQQQQMEDSHEESSLILANIMKQAEKLHSAFLVVHNACTEHLSLLHLCYELSATKTSEREAIRFWTEQLKEAHLCRYSNELVGRDLATLRKVLKHTRTVLRTQDGWKNSSSQNGMNSFI